MTIITLFGSKGGVGTSILATNLAEGLAASDRVLLMDLAAVAGGDDLLMDLDVNKSWADLIPVASELTDHHLRAAIAGGSDRAYLLAAPMEFVDVEPTHLIRSIGAKFDWLIIDAGSGVINGSSDLREFLLQNSAQCLLVTTLDPLSLRATSRWLSALRGSALSPIELIASQWQPDHPVDPSTLAESLGIHLGAVLPYAPNTVAYQVNYGVPIVRQPGSSYSRSLVRLIRRYRALWMRDLPAEG